MKFDKLVTSIQNTHDGLQRLQPNEIGQSLTDELKSIDYQSKTIRQTLSDEFKKTLLAQANKSLRKIKKLPE